MIHSTTKIRKLRATSVAKATALVLAATLVLVPLGQAAEVRYHGNVESKIFHERSCRYFHCKACTREFSTKEEAEMAGYRPCKVCKP